MSKLIVEMEMPKDCPMCPMAHYNKLDEFTGCEVAAGKLFAVTRDKAYAESTCRPDWCPIKGEISDIELMHLEEERAFAARNIAAESEADADYQLSVLMQEYFERYEPTYNSEDGSM